MTKPLENEIIFYDGHCGFCHRWVKFVVKKDTKAHFVFAPRESECFREHVAEDRRADLPPSILVCKQDGEILMFSTATLYILKQIGGVYGFISVLGSLCPKFIRDLCYRIIAKIRHKIYATPEGLCPIVPSEYRSRFKL